MSRTQRHDRGAWGFLPAMRFLERRAGTKPRIGQSRRLSEDIVEMGQDPFLGFADSDFSQIDMKANPPKVRPRFLGFFGPFGPLPAPFTREVEHWAARGDISFVRFADILVTRFQQLFYRSWSDARPITQFDHPSGGTFPRFLRGLTGDTSTTFDKWGAIDDIVRLRYTPLSFGRVRSPTKLRQMIKAHFGVSVRVEEFVTSWLEFAPEDQSVMGLQGMGLGQDTRIGRRAPSIGEKIVLHVECGTLAQYRSFLPGRDRQAELKDLVLGYTGGFFEVDVALWLPRSRIGQAQLGVGTELGWTSSLPLTTTTQERRDELVRACQYKIELQDLMI